MPNSDPIRIVPLYRPPTRDLAAAAVPPKLTYRGGPLIQSVKIFTVFWGSAWANKPALAAVAQKINAFFQFIVTSSLMDEMTEYNVPDKAIQHGSFIGTANVRTPAPRAKAKDASIRKLIQREIVKGTLPKSTPDTLYFVFAPPGTSIVDGTHASCSQFCGYHNSIGNGLFYAAMPYPDCNGCLGGMNDFDALTGTSSHELCEAITDPIPGSGWYDDTNGEIGDICGWQFKKVGGYTVQLEWSNRANACI